MKSSGKFTDVLIVWGTLVGVIWLLTRQKQEPAPPPEPMLKTAEEQRVNAVRQAAKRWGIDTALALQVSRQENSDADRFAWSPNGCCVGIMQIHVRYWLGRYDSECGGSDLVSFKDNACYGVLRLKAELTKCNGDVPCALAAYQGAQTMEDGQEYVDAVLRRRVD